MFSFVYKTDIKYYKEVKVGIHANKLLLYT